MLLQKLLQRLRHGARIGTSLMERNRDLLDGQYRNPVRIAAFNTTEGWSRDVTEEIAVALHERCADAGAVPQSLQQFLERHGQ